MIEVRIAMDSKISIKRNYLYNISYQMVSALIPILLTPYIARVLTPTGVGVSSYITANVTYFQLFSMLGIAGYGQREIAIVRDDKYKTSRVFWELQLLHIVFSLIVLIAYYLFVQFVASPINHVYYLISVITLFASLLDITWLYKGVECFRDVAIKNVIAKGFVILFCFLFVKTENDLEIYVAINALGIFVSNVFLWSSIYQYVLPLRKVKDLQFYPHIKHILVFFIPTIAASIYSILDKTVINIITHSNEENGYYENATKILTILNVAVQNLSSVMAPRMANLFGSGDYDKLRSYLNSALEMMLLLAMPLAFGMASISKNFVPIFLGDGWDEVIPLLYVFMPLVIILGLNVYLDGMFLVPTGKRFQSARAICIGAAINLGLNFVLVSYWKAFGAAIATMITELIISIQFIFLSRDVIDGKKIISAFCRYGIYSLIVFLISIMIDEMITEKMLSLLLQITVGIVIYVVLLLITKDKNANNLLKNIKV